MDTVLFKFKPNRYVLTESDIAPFMVAGEKLITLTQNNWDDYSYKTTYYAQLWGEDRSVHDIGRVKIIHENQTHGYPNYEYDTRLRFDDRYCSLGQDVEYYENLSTLPRNLRNEYLSSLKDAAVDPAVYQKFKEMEVWNVSVLRFGEAKHALKQARQIVNNDIHSTGKAEFRFSRDRSVGEEFDFSFNGRDDIPGRFNVLVGYNGVGKTQLLADIATTFIGDKNEFILKGTDDTFSKIIAVSYSAFDTFVIPVDPHSSGLHYAGGDDQMLFGYKYCGLRQVTGNGEADQLKSVSEITKEFEEAIDLAVSTERSKEALKAALAVLGREPSFGRIFVKPEVWPESPEQAKQEILKLSTGHKIVANIILQLAVNLKQRSLVLIDEPETHLHPPLLSALIKAILGLLEEYDSYAILATHSPVVLQETPSENVIVLERYGNSISTRRPEIETFGENVGTLTRHVFNLDGSATDYREVLRSLASKFSIEEIEGMFPRGLSSQARALVSAAKRRAEPNDLLA